MSDNVSVSRNQLPLQLEEQYLPIGIENKKNSINDSNLLNNSLIVDDIDDNNSTDVSEELQSSICKKCNLPINEGHAYELGDDHWHTYCFKCSKCDELLGVQSNFLVLGTGTLVCSSCSYSCKNCGKKIDDLAILTGDQAYCSSCFCCRSCKRKIEDLKYARTSKGLFCMPCHERLLEKKRKHDQMKRLLLQQTRSRNSDLIDKNLPEIPSFASISSSSSNLDMLMTPQLTKESTVISPSKDDQEVILDIPLRSPQRNTDAQLKLLLSTSPVTSALGSPPTIATPREETKSPSQRNIPLSPKHAANRNVVVIDSAQEVEPVVEHDTESESFVEMDINIDYSEKQEVKGLNIENLSLKPELPPAIPNPYVEPLIEDAALTKSPEVISTPNSKSRTFKFGSGNGTPKSPSEKGMTRSLSIRSPKKFFHRHKRSISGSLDLNNSTQKLPLPPTEEDPAPITPATTLAPDSSTLAYRTPPIPSISSFSNGHQKTMSQASNDGLKNQSELELRSITLEIHNMESIKSSLKVDIDNLNSEKDKLQKQVAEERKILLKLQNENKNLSTKLKNLSSSSSILLPVEKSTPTASSQSSQPSQPSTLPPLPPSQSAPPAKTSSSSSSSNVIEEPHAIQQVEEIQEVKPKQKARFWRRPKITKTKDLIISSPSNMSINKDLEENFVTNLEDSNNKPQLKKIVQNLNNSPKKVDVRELFGVALEVRCQYEHRTTPFIVTKCIEVIESKGLEIEGIYRISGGTTLVEKLENSFKEYPDGQLKNLNELLDQDVHAVSSVLKRYLRKLPNPMIPYDMYGSFIELSTYEQNSSLRLDKLKLLIKNLPELNYLNLILILKHLLKIFEKSTLNKMTLKNISVVFGPTLIRDVNAEREITDMSSRTIVLEFILENFDELFNKK